MGPRAEAESFQSDNQPQKNLMPVPAQFATALLSSPNGSLQNGSLLKRCKQQIRQLRRAFH
jgi:hypothetical protein